MRDTKIAEWNKCIEDLRNNIDRLECRRLECEEAFERVDRAK